MIEFIQRVLKATKKYTIIDYAFLKIAILSLGILLGAYFAKYFLNHTLFLWVVYIISFLWILYKTFVEYQD
jgi:hypothetical protein